MYIQITTRCNMTCAHCCYACTETGDDMSLETFKNALMDDDHISIGGGEPTIHPQFWQMIGLALGRAEHVWLATNGAETDTALALAGLAEKGVLGCDLSQDEYHDEIDTRVVDAFMTPEGFRHDKDNDMRGVRNVTKNREPFKAGRCDWGEDGCVCEDLIVRPNGDVAACGCADAPIVGNVNNGGFNLPEDWEHGLCHKEQEAKVA